MPNVASAPEGVAMDLTQPKTGSFRPVWRHRNYGITDIVAVAAVVQPVPAIWAVAFLVPVRSCETDENMTAALGRTKDLVAHHKKWVLPQGWPCGIEAHTNYGRFVASRARSQPVHTTCPATSR